jgi:hypothetical protein
MYRAERHNNQVQRTVAPQPPVTLSLPVSRGAVSKAEASLPKASMDLILQRFLSTFKKSFQPPVPYRGRSGSNWFVSGVWSQYMKEWLAHHYRVEYEYLLPGRRRLDAAVWAEAERAKPNRRCMDIALEWEWDNNKVVADFSCGDFRKLFEVDATCGLAIVQTRVDGRRGTDQANEVLRKLQRLSAQYRRDDRSVALVEVRRVRHQRERVDFACYFQDLSNPTRYEAVQWSYE